MTVVSRLKYLRIILILAGLACLALYPLILFWPSGWIWHAGHSDYPMMIVGIYATLGVFLILAARDPLANLSLSGSPCGLASYTEESWLFRRSPSRRKWGTWQVMCRRSSSWRSH